LITLPQLVAEIVMALGGALLFANVYALLQPRFRPEKTPAKPIQRGRALTNALIGLLIFVWGFASFIARL
jgi:drug/metabolite transporter (DMT)-like permease